MVIICFSLVDWAVAQQSKDDQTYSDLYKYSLKKRL